MIQIDTHDAQAIAAYLRQQRPDYRGPVFIDLVILQDKHAARAQADAQAIIERLTISPAQSR